MVNVSTCQVPSQVTRVGVAVGPGSTVRAAALLGEPLLGQRALRLLRRDPDVRPVAALADVSRGHVRDGRIVRIDPNVPDHLRIELPSGAAIARACAERHTPQQGTQP